MRMQDWLRTFHGSNAPYPVLEIAVKMALAISLGLLVGLEREWSNKDIGARTFAMAALLGLLGSLLGQPALLFCGAAVLILMIFANVRGVLVARKMEATTSAALAIIFLLGVLIGQGHLFTPVACAIFVAMLLALKPQLRAFAGGLTQQEVRGALVLALLGFVVWPLMPDRFVDPWHLLEPSEAWITVIVVACLGFMNYVLLRVFGSRGVYLTSVLGGLVNSTASTAELTSRLAGTALAPLLTSAVLLTSIAMFFRNVLILAIFARAVVPIAVPPLVAMCAAAAYWVFRDRKRAGQPKEEVSLDLDSPVSFAKVLRFALLFLSVQVLATMAQRLAGSAGFQAVSILGGLFSSASTTAAAANMAIHGQVTPLAAGTAVVLTSISSAVVNLPIVYRRTKGTAIFRELILSTALQVVAGVAVLVLQAKWVKIF
jgi:uncharacterized membrane protein (DUF4010 family)